MYICPICNKEFQLEEKIVKHLSICWKEKNSNHIPKEAPRSKNIIIRTVNNDIANFFEGLNYGRNFN